MPQTPPTQVEVPQQSAESEQCPPSEMQEPEVSLQVPPTQVEVPQQSVEVAQCEPGPTQPPESQIFWALQVAVPQQSPWVWQCMPALTQGTLPPGIGGGGSGSSGMSQPPAKGRKANTAARASLGIEGTVIV